MFIRFGTKELLLAVHDPYPFQCPSCKELNTVDFAITCEYFHIWYIPVFPTGKDGNAKCSHCDFRVSTLKFNKNTKELFKEIKRKYRYPFYLYTGISILLLPFVAGLIALFFF